MGFTEATHPTYDDKRSDWQIIKRMKTGENVKRELLQNYFEHNNHYQKRREYADFTPHTNWLINRLVGLLEGRSDEAKRTAIPIDQTDFEYIGTKGEDWQTLVIQIAETLLAYNKVWVVVDPASGIEVVDPLAVPNWNSQAVTVKQQMVPDGPLDEDRTKQDIWSVYRPQGVQVFSQDDKDNDVPVSQSIYAEAEPQPFFVDREGNPTPPVVCIEMPWEANFGLSIAKKHRQMFRMGSRRDFQTNVAMNAIIQLGVGGNEQLAEKITQKARSGKMMWPYDKESGEHKGLEIPTAGAELGSEILEEKRKELRRTAFDSLERGARTAQSATEAVIQREGAEAAALGVLARTVADAEAQTLHLYSQVQDFAAFAGPAPQPTGVEVEWPSDWTSFTAEQPALESDDEETESINQ